MTTPEITPPPEVFLTFFPAGSSSANLDDTFNAVQAYARLAMAPLQERIRELEASNSHLLTQLANSVCSLEMMTADRDKLVGAAMGDDAYVIGLQERSELAARPVHAPPADARQEPVAWMLGDIEKYVDDHDLMIHAEAKRKWVKDQPDGFVANNYTVPLYAAPPADTRAKALEEAAKICELELMAWGPGAAYSNQSIESAAAAIRAAIRGKP